MGRFNTTKSGYRFDKIIFWSSTLIILLIVAALFSLHGLSFKPYLKCDQPVCENPFYHEQFYGCSWAFGMQECDIEEYEWMKEEFLSKGEYGEKPLNLGYFVLIVFSIYILAICLNHFLWNKGKKFHLDVIDKISKE